MVGPLAPFSLNKMYCVSNIHSQDSSYPEKFKGGRPAAFSESIVNLAFNTVIFQFKVNLKVALLR